MTDLLDVVVTSDEAEALETFNRQVALSYQEISATVDEPDDVAMATALAEWRAARARFWAEHAALAEVGEIRLLERLREAGDDEPAVAGRDLLAAEASQKARGLVLWLVAVLR